MRIFFFTSILLFSSLHFFSVKAQFLHQQPDNTNEPDCKQTYSEYYEFYKKEYYLEAFHPWKQVFHHCPSLSENMYKHGIKIYRHFIAQETDSLKRAEFVDKIFQIYAQREQYFGKNKHWATKEAIEIIKLRPQKADIAYDILRDLLASDKKMTGLEAVSAFAKVSEKMYAAGKITKQEAALNYMRIIDKLRTTNKIYKKQINRADYRNFNEKYTTIKKQIAQNKANKIYAQKQNELKTLVKKNKQSYLAFHCKSLENQITQNFKNSAFSDSVFVFRLLKEYENTTSIAAQNTKLYYLLNSLSKCNNSDYELKFAKQLYEIKKSSWAASALAKAYVRKKQFSEAIALFHFASDNSDDKRDKAKYEYDIALLQFQADNFVEAKKSVLKVIEFSSDWGKPYLLIGKIYATGAKQLKNTNKLDANAAFWVAVDKFEQAKALDPKLGIEVDLLIQEYKKHFPNKEDAFFLGIKEGDKYKVGGWINETTKARFL